MIAYRTEQKSRGHLYKIITIIIVAFLLLYFSNPNRNFEELEDSPTNLERWPRWTTERRHYQTLDVDISGRHQGPLARHCEYWRTLVPLLRHQCSEEAGYCTTGDDTMREEDPDG